MRKPGLYTTTWVCCRRVIKQSLQCSTAAAVAVAKLMQLAVGTSCGLLGELNGDFTDNSFPPKPSVAGYQAIAKEVLR